MSTAPPRKRSSDTDAEKLPKKRSKDVLSVVSEQSAANTTRKVPVMVGETPRAAPAPSKGRNQPAPAVVDDTPSGKNGSMTIPKPPRMVTGDIPVPPQVETPLAENRPSRTATPKSPVAAAAAAPATEPTATVRAAGPSRPNKARTSWYFVLVFGLAAILLLSNLLTLGLWVMTNLELDLKVRELAVVAGAEEDYTSSPYDSLKQILEGLADEKNSLASKVAEVTPKLEGLVSEKNKLLEDLAGLRDRVFNSANEKVSLSTELGRVRQHAEHLDHEKRALAEELEQLRSKSEELNILVERGEEAVRVQQHWEEEAGRMLEERDTWHRHSLRMQHERDRARATLQTQLEGMAKQLEESRESLAVGEKEREELQALVTDLMEQKKELQERCTA